MLHNVRWVSLHNVPTRYLYKRLRRSWKRSVNTMQFSAGYGRDQGPVTENSTPRPISGKRALFHEAAGAWATSKASTPRWQPTSEATVWGFR
jgi:hypothetical protein